MLFWPHPGGDAASCPSYLPIVSVHLARAAPVFVLINAVLSSEKRAISGSAVTGRTDDRIIGGVFFFLFRQA